MKKTIFLAAFLLKLSSLFSQQIYESLIPDQGECVVFLAACDWGACVEKILICTEKKWTPDQIHAEDFDVDRLLYSTEELPGLTKGQLTVTDAFTSDEYGRKTESPSSFITITTDLHPAAENSNPFLAKTFKGKIRSYYGYKVENDELDFTIKKLKGFVNREASKFSTSRFNYVFPSSDEKITMNYAYFIPEKKEASEEKIPLILWFHGMGESGNNINSVIFGTKTTAFLSEKIQSHFSGGIALLAPQCPTGWLETTEIGKGNIRVWEPFDKDGTIDRVKNPVKKFFGTVFALDEGVKTKSSEEESPKKDEEESEKTPYAAVSWYTEPVLALLNDFLDQHPEIDRKRIYAGGCSAGGYMTVNMMIQKGELFAAAFPVCEYYLDSKITNAQIDMLSQKALWFTYSLNDESVRPEKCSLPTIARLKKAGSKNLHLSEFKKVIDTSGKYLLNREAGKDDSDYGLPYEYEGHASWIYLFNDECKEKELNLFDWLSSQTLD